MSEETVTVGKYRVIKSLLYTESDEYVRIVDKVAIVGITDYAQKKLRDIVAVDLPQPGRQVKSGEVVAVIESVKAASDLYAPMTGVVVQVNEEARTSPEIVNQDPYGRGWLFKIEYTDPGEIKSLLDWSRYAEKIRE